MRLSDLKDDIVLFDFDGTLCRYDFGELGVKIFECHDWVRQNMERNVYDFAPKTSLFDELIKEKDESDIYVLSVALSSFEQKNKIEFLNKYYNKIPLSNILFVADWKYKVDVLQELRESYDSVGKHHKRIVLIEDSAEVMAYVESLNDERIRCFLLSDFI